MTSSLVNMEDDGDVEMGEGENWDIFL
jgi:hypothetical protein